MLYDNYLYEENPIKLALLVNSYLHYIDKAQTHEEMERLTEEWLEKAMGKSLETVLITGITGMTDH